MAGKYTDDESFRRDLLERRIIATEEGFTHADRAKGEKTNKSPGGFTRTNDRKFIKLAVRVLYLRMTSGEYKYGDKNYDAIPLPCDKNPRLKPPAAFDELARLFKPWSIGREAIRKEHTPFQDEC